MNIYIMRHGETEWNKRKVLQGQADISLNENGIRQAEEASEVFRDSQISFDTVYTSHLDRAMETAQIVSGVPRADMIVDDRIIEMDYGSMDGVGFGDVGNEMMAFLMDPINVLPPSGVETLENLTERVGLFLEDLKALDKGQNVLVLTHGVALRAMIGYLRNMKRPGREIWGMPIGNCATFLIRCENGELGEPELFIRDEE